MCLTVRLSYLIQITIVGLDGKEEYSPVSLFGGSLACRLSQRFEGTNLISIYTCPVGLKSINMAMLDRS